MIKASKETDAILEIVSGIYYLVQFKNNKIKALIDLESKVNAITPAFATKLGFKVFFTNVRTQKIDRFNLKMFRMVLASF